MAVAFYVEFPDMSTEQAEQVLQDLNLGGKAPAGQIFHSEGPLQAGGTWVVDVWDSPEALQAFVEQKLAPIMQRLGVTPPQPNLVPVRVVLTPQELRRL
jgi:hypothetical protein